MFDCLIGLIGIGDGVLETPESGLYVTTLPDINFNEIGKIADSDQSDISKVWKDVELRGVLKFRTLFISELNNCHKINKIDLCECLICENKMLLATSLWYLLGAELMNERINSNRINRFTTIDKAKAKELRNDFMTLFHQELSISVSGIDIHSSECFEEPIEEKRISTFTETTP